jgi:two-component system CheB/CheR fusion protein
MSDPTTRTGTTETREEAFEELLEYIRAVRGFDFTGYKRPSLRRRVDKRMQAVGLETYVEYLDQLQVHQGEFTELFDTILINVTSFFRDPGVWDLVAGTLIPAVVASKAPDEPIRVWSAGTASGEEAYTVAMLLVEALGEDGFRTRVKIYATDVDDAAIAHARRGVYSGKDVEPVFQERRERFFERMGGAYVFRRDLRRALIFGRHDLVQDAPISRTDLIVCRNTLMYLDSDTQKQVIVKFSFSLNDGGFLILGKSEMLFTRVRDFGVMDLKLRVFQRERTDRAGVATLFGDGEPAERAEELPRLAFDEAPAAQVMVRADGRLLAVNRRARDLLGVQASDVGRPLQDLEVSYRPIELRGPIEEAFSKGSFEIRDVVWRARDGSPLTLDVQVSRLAAAGGLEAVLVAFVDVSEAGQLQHDLETSNQELETAMEELQSTNEELETTNEELQSTNEELETTNEELQSTNEELETMNEELHSTNEELQTLNEELHERTTELAGLNTFMSSILASVRGAVVVLDDEMRVRVWNAQAYELWGLRDDEVQGSSLMGLDIGLPLDPVREQIRRTLGGDADQDTIEVDATNRRGRAVLVRITSSRLQPDAGRGVILLMEELDALA